ncbi:MAG: hypothetical protein IJD48_04755 [Clostridia bacterium]|nr:hypothetical protein [Clostridia bacterium]
MQDNGLLKYYREKADKAGFLITGELPFEKDPVVKLKYKMEGRDFYIKRCYPFDVCPEVLLSQVFAAAGLKTAIYLPAIDGQCFAVVSNDVQTDNTIKGTHFFDVIRDRIATDTETAAFSGKSGSLVDYTKYLAPKAMHDLALFQTLDLACFNADRHVGNIYADLEDPYDEYRALGFVGFDYGASFTSSETDPRLVKYYNIFGTGRSQTLFDMQNFLQRKEDILNFLRENETINTFAPRHEIAETLAGIDTRGIVADIKEQTGYDIDKHYAARIERSLYQTAEQLDQ